MSDAKGAHGMTALIDDEPCLDMLHLPLAYGYLRVRWDAPDEVNDLEQRLCSFAAGRGLYFVTYFFDCACGTTEGFSELLAELRRADAHHVVIPARHHLASHPFGQQRLARRLADEAAADVLVLAETHQFAQ